MGIKKELIDLGKFEVVSNTLRISDPCYNKKTWCAGTVKKAMKGTWKAQVLKKEIPGWGNRCRKLVAVHESFDKSKCTFKKLNIDVGVDSGCAGIFDDQFYGVDFEIEQPMFGHQEYEQRQCDYQFETFTKTFQKMYDTLKSTGKDLTQYPFLLDYEDMKEPTKAPLNFEKEWRKVVSDVAFSNIGAGVVHNGVVSSSGLGDGSYVAYAAYNNDGKVVGVKILF